MCHAASGTPRRDGLELADIVREYGAALRAAYPLTSEQLAVLHDIVRCRTALLGGHLEVCPDCGMERPVYNACRNRHCPKCQCLAAERWIAARQLRLLDTRHYHVVFTLPAELRGLARFRPELVFNMLFECAAETLQELGRNPTHLGAQLGITMVLHTWSRELAFHPHVHCVVTGGGLSFDGARWIPAGKGRFLFPVTVMGELFRGKFLDSLRLAERRGDFAGFSDFDDPEGFDHFMRRLALRAKSWHVYVKRAFRKAQYVLQYLGRYTHRVGIANSRLVSLVDGRVTFRTKNGKTCTLDAVEFLHRFVAHVLPRRFVKIRHYGLLAPGNVNDKLQKARAMLAPRAAAIAAPTAPASPTSWMDLHERLTGRSLRRCPRCGASLIMRPLPSPPTLARAPP